ncbi:MAG: N-acetylmuramoyl-L-alanine amidase [Alphaproteobacteria bacterium]|nr:N-acetylmuramoyl-L-alanine amidase [Rhodospirillales bacterium]MCW9045365.1 N-acetylmuramoyl-L-alanine amidase [Alphaproteobacteria bacterium]
MLERLSPNFNDRRGNQPIDMLVLHYTGMKTADEAMERLCNPEAEVSAHYVIDEKGGITKMVEEENRAWHAGVSSWRGETDINSRSIGIELINPGHEFGYREFTEFQMASLEILAHDILRRHPIPERNVVGHSDIAPQRKTDPGELFDWEALARVGIGLFLPRSKPQKPNVKKAQNKLAKIGYEINLSGEIDPQTKSVIKAFQRHFRPLRVDGLLDPDTAGRITSLTEII